jgi:hypothetical protein
MSLGLRSWDCMESETGSEAAENVDANFLKASSEARRLEREAMPNGNKVFPSGAIFEQFDVEKISINSYEEALKSAEEIESKGVKAGAKKTEKEEKAGRVMSEKELERIPEEKVKVLTRSEEEIAAEETKLKNMKEKFAKLMSEMPNEQPVQIAPKAEPVPEAPRDTRPILGPPKNEPDKAMESALEAAKAGEKPVVDAAKAEEIKELSENFKKITMKKEEREKQERIRKMKKEIEDMLESG